MRRRRSDSLIVRRLKERERQLKTPSHRTVINNIKKYHIEQRRAPLDTGLLSSEYEVFINDESIINPFIVSPGMVLIAKEQTKNHSSLEGKARALFHWLHDNIEYSMKPDTYRNAKETLAERKGICGEMSFLYITMARSTGLQSSLATVTKDYKGEEVAHGCAVVNIGYRDVLADIAYHQFDINHQEYRVRTDADVLRMFNQWRNK